MLRVHTAWWGLTAAAAAVGLGIAGVVILPTAMSDGPHAAMAGHEGRVTAVTAGKGQLAAASASPASTRPAGHFNVGNTHSPRLERQLASPSGTSGPVINSPAQAATAGPVNGAAQGVDVSSRQHPKGAAIDWGAAASAGIKFAAVKVSEGAYYPSPTNPDPYSTPDLKDARAAGLTTVAYAFAIPNGGIDSNGNQLPASPQVQADHLISNLPTDIPVPPIMLDIEYDPYAGTGPHGDGTTGVCYGERPAYLVNWISGFDAEIQAKTGRLPIIYTTQDWWSTCTGGSTVFGNTPVWPADPTNSSPALPAGWNTWNLWQYSSDGTVAGFPKADDGATDLDQLSPDVITLLNAGSRTSTAGSANKHPQVTPFTVDPAPSLTYSAAGLPAGLSINPATGVIAGWADKPGTYQTSVTATDTNSTAGSASYAWAVTAAPSSGPAGAVRLDLGGKCLDDNGNSSADGTAIVIWTCNGSAAQTWTVVKDDTLRIHGKCLHVLSSATTSGTAVNLHACNGSSGEFWQVRTGTQLVNPHSGLCLTDPGSSTTNGKQVQIRTCLAQPKQEWTLPAGPVVSGSPGKCLDDSGNGATVVVSACNGSTEQKWVAKPGGTVRVNGKCLAASGGLAIAASCTTGDPAQQWLIKPDGSGTTLENAGACLAYQGDGKQAQLAGCPASGDQLDPATAWRVH